MLEIIALCSCACLACLWCALAFEVAKDKYRGKWIFHNTYGRQSQNANCNRQNSIARQTRCQSCKHSYLRPFRNIPSYRFVCKTCHHVKPECVCAKLFRYGMAMGHNSNKCQPVDHSSIRDSILPNLDSGAVVPCSRCTECCKHIETFRQNRELNHHRKQCRSSFRKQILGKKRRRKRIKNTKE